MCYSSLLTYTLRTRGTIQHLRGWPEQRHTRMRRKKKVEEERGGRGGSGGKGGTSKIPRKRSESKDQTLAIVTTRI